MDLYIESNSLKFEEVEEFLEEVLLKYNISKRLNNKIILCVKEAVTNSIVHGNKFDSQKMVNIKVTRCHDQLYIKIKDQGEGFDYNNLHDPTLVDTIRNETGRGLFLMSKLSDGIVFRDNGKVVQVKINLSDND